jgi:hypothetical protein
VEVHRTVCPVPVLWYSHSYEGASSRHKDHSSCGVDAPDVQNGQRLVVTKLQYRGCEGTAQCSACEGPFAQTPLDRLRGF